MVNLQIKENWEVSRDREKVFRKICREILSPRETVVWTTKCICEGDGGFLVGTDKSLYWEQRFNAP